MTVSHGMGQWFGGVNRRRQRIWRLGGRIVARSRWDTLPNPAGPVDRAVRAVVFRNRTGEVEGVGWNASCHPVGFPAQLSISADYPGFVRSHVRRALRIRPSPSSSFRASVVTFVPIPPSESPRLHCCGESGSGGFRVVGHISDGSPEPNTRGGATRLPAEVCRVLQEAKPRVHPSPELSAFKDASR